MRLLLTQANALKIPLADESVHCVVTSPPYWGLRDYGIGGQLGLEPTPEQYVANMVAVFREVRRVLRDDGTVWLNLGDSYAGGVKGSGNRAEQDENFRNSKSYSNKGGLGYKQKLNYNGLKPKDLCGIPWRVAFALQADGWWLRSDIIWSKPNPMPESVTDRPTKAHEYLFLLTKSARYYYDADAVREPHVSTPERYEKEGSRFRDHGKYLDVIQGGKDTPFGNPLNPAGRNRRTVWHIATAPYSGAHFATYPPALVEPCIKAGTSERGVCPECGAPWERVVEKTKEDVQTRPMEYGKTLEVLEAGDDRRVMPYMRTGEKFRWKVDTLGWQPTCEHDAEPIPAIVFDPFAGSGTTLQVARALGRNGVGLDLSLEYLHLARQRLSLDALEAWGKGKKDGATVTDLPMFEGLE
jgi:DNA modification methylase